MKKAEVDKQLQDDPFESEESRIKPISDTLPFARLPHREVREIELKPEAPLAKNLPDYLAFAIEHIYTAAGLSISKAVKEKYEEGEEYKAYRFDIQSNTNTLKKHIAFRVGKVTPSRPGNFVTLWKRSKSVIEPIDVGDGVDFAVVHVSNGKMSGEFIFDKTILLHEKIFSDTKNSKKGKLAFRVFPPWSEPAKSALKTQEWQLKYFFAITKNKTINYKQILKLFKIA